MNHVKISLDDYTDLYLTKLKFDENTEKIRKRLADEFAKKREEWYTSKFFQDEKEQINAQNKKLDEREKKLSEFAEEVNNECETLRNEKQAIHAERQKLIAEHEIHAVNKRLQEKLGQLYPSLEKLKAMVIAQEQLQIEYNHSNTPEEIKENWQALKNHNAQILKLANEIAIKP